MQLDDRFSKEGGDARIPRCRLGLPFRRSFEFHGRRYPPSLSWHVTKFPSKFTFDSYHRDDTTRSLTPFSPTGKTPSPSSSSSHSARSHRERERHVWLEADTSARVAIVYNREQMIGDCGRGWLLQHPLSDQISNLRPSDELIRASNEIE